MKIYKRLGTAIAPFVMHLINSIIYSTIYPNVLKISRITPTLKPEKEIDSLNSYRPINNLSALDKLIQHYIKEQLQNHLDDNSILLDFHLGSRENYSTHRSRVTS